MKITNSARRSGENRTAVTVLEWLLRVLSISYFLTLVVSSAADGTAFQVRTFSSEPHAKRRPSGEKTTERT